MKLLLLEKDYQEVGDTAYYDLILTVYLNKMNLYIICGVPQTNTFLYLDTMVVR